MVDEFQDTSEIQFKLALLIAGTDNICVVGDWKQSIYSFQYADVENILEFEDRLDRFSAELNDEQERVSFPITDVKTIEIEENHRSTQTILDFAEAYALGEAVSPTAEGFDDQRHVKEFIDGLSGKLHVEERAVLPLEVDGEQVTVSGLVDLVHEIANRIEIIDYKTDQTTRAESEYRKQLSIYYHVINECFPGKDIEASIFYTGTAELVPIEPLSIVELKSIVSTAQQE